MAASDVLSPETIQIAEGSLRRCASDPFFQAFYKRLLQLDAATRAKFAKTDFSRQNKLLQHGLGLLFTFAKHRNPKLLERIATSHAKHELDIQPAQYAYFEECLLAAVREFDPQWSKEIEGAWHLSIAPGIAFMAAQYEHAASGDGSRSATNGDG